MISHKKIPVILSLIAIVTILLASCKTKTIIETVEVPIEVEKSVQVEVLITPTPIPIPQGGSVVFGNILDPGSLNPILAPDNRTVLQLFLPLFRINYFTGEIVGRIAESWSSSEDGLTYTFKLRDDIYWTDGTPLTAWDFKFTYDALHSEFVEGLSLPQIESINVIDDYSLEIVFNTIHCAYMLNNLLIPPLPSHMYAEDFSDVIDSPLSEAPTVTSGPFKFQEWVKGDHITLVRNENYYLGAPHIERHISLTFEDDESHFAAFLAGEIDVISVDAEYISVIEAEIAKGQPFAIHKYLDDGYFFVAFNMANPEKAEIGWEDLNEDGIFDEDEPPNLSQDPHPILSDVRVRKAIVYSLDYTNIINKAFFGQGAPIVANVLPSIEWAYNDELEPYHFDPEMAADLLDEAGWIREDEEAVRMKEGKPLALSILTNAGNEIRMNIATILKDNLDALGFDITLDILDWGTVVGKVLNQQFDMVVLSWTGMGSDPADSSFWAYRYDVPGSGFNFVSYYNEEVEKLLFEAAYLPGCSLEERGAMYKRIQELIHEDAPYAFIFNPLSNVVWNTRLVNFDPTTWIYGDLNIQDWYLKP